MVIYMLFFLPTLHIKTFMRRFFSCYELCGFGWIKLYINAIKTFGTTKVSIRLYSLVSFSSNQLLSFSLTYIVVHINFFEFRFTVAYDFFSVTMTHRYAS